MNANNAFYNKSFPADSPHVSAVPSAELPVGNNRKQPPPPPTQPDINKTEVSYWIRQLFTPAGIMGLLFCFLQLPILFVNSYILAIRFEQMFHTPGTPLFTLTVGSIYREVTDFDIFGLLVSVIIMGLAAAYAFTRLNADFKAQFLKNIALAGWILLAVFEVVVSGVGAAATGGGMANAILSAMMAAGIVTVEGVFGIFVVDYFLIPLSLSLFWTLALPFNFIKHQMLKFREKRKANVPGRLAKKAEREAERKKKSAAREAAKELKTSEKQQKKADKQLKKQGKVLAKQEKSAEKKRKRENGKKIYILPVLASALQEAIFTPLDNLDNLIFKRIPARIGKLFNRNKKSENKEEYIHEIY